MNETVYKVMSCSKNIIFYKMKFLKTMPMSNRRNSVISYECKRRRHHGCKATVLGEEMVGRVNEHNHAADVARKEVITIRSTMKRRAEPTEETHNRSSLRKQWQVHREVNI